MKNLNKSIESTCRMEIVTNRMNAMTLPTFSNSSQFNFISYDYYKDILFYSFFISLWILLSWLDTNQAWLHHKVSHPVVLSIKAQSMVDKHVGTFFINNVCGHTMSWIVKQNINSIDKTQAINRNWLRNNNEKNPFTLFILHSSNIWYEIDGNVIIVYFISTIRLWIKIIILFLLRSIRFKWNEHENGDTFFINSQFTDIWDYGEEE